MKNKQKGFTGILIIFVVAITLIGSGTYFLQSEKLPQSKMDGDENQISENSSPVTQIPISETVVTQVPKPTPMPLDKIEQEKIKENMIAAQNQKPVDMVSKPCTNDIKAEESSSIEYSSLVHAPFKFKKAIISDFDCDGDKDLIVASYVEIEGEGEWAGIGKANLQYFEKVNDMWKEINNNDFLSPQFYIRPGKTLEGGNAVVLTFEGESIVRTVWIRNGYPTGI